VAAKRTTSSRRRYATASGRSNSAGRAKLTLAADGGCRSKVSAAGGEGDGGGCAALAVFVVGSAVTVGAGSGPRDGELVAVNLVEVVGHHQQAPLEAHLGPASSVESVDAAVVFGVAEQRLDCLFALSIPLLAVL